MNKWNYDFICTWYWVTHKGHRTNQTWRIMMNNTWRTRLLYFSDTFLPRNFCWKGNLGHLIENKCGYKCISSHVDVIKSKHFPRYWPFVLGIHRSPVNSPHKGQWHGALMFSLIFVWINDWVNNREAGDLRRYHTHYDVTVMRLSIIMRARPYMAVFVFRCKRSLCLLRQMHHQNPADAPPESHGTIRIRCTPTDSCWRLQHEDRKCLKVSYLAEWFSFELMFYWNKEAENGPWCFRNTL